MYNNRTAQQTYSGGSGGHFLTCSGSGSWHRPGRVFRYAGEQYAYIGYGWIGYVWGTAIMQCCQLEAVIDSVGEFSYAPRSL